jgi:hypothetical protein
MQYWGDLPGQMVSSLLGLGDDYSDEGALEAADIPQDMRDAFLQYLVDNAGNAEHDAAMFLDEVKLAGEKALRGFARKHGVDADDYDVQSFGDDLAHSEMFGLIGGVPEYNEEIDVLEHIIRVSGTPEDPHAVLDAILAKIDTDGSEVTEAAADLWQEAKKAIADMQSEDPKYWSESVWREVLPSRLVIVIGDNTYDLYDAGRFIESFPTEDAAAEAAAYEIRNTEHGVADVFFYDATTGEVTDYYGDVLFTLDWTPQQAADPRQQNLPLEARVRRSTRRRF